MASITLTVPDELVPRVVAAIQSTGFEQEAGENDGVFVKRYIRWWIAHLDWKRRRKSVAGAIIPEDMIEP